MSLATIAESRANMYRVKPSKIKGSRQFNGRYSQESDDVSALAESLLVRQLQPVGVRPIRSSGQDYVELVYGFRRWQAALVNARAVPDFTLDVIVVPEGSDIEAFEANVQENLHQLPLTAMENARNVERLIKAGKSQKYVAKVYGKSISWVSSMLQLLKLPSDVQARVDDEELSYPAALEIARAPEAVRPKVIQQAKRAIKNGERLGRPAVVEFVRKEREKEIQAGRGDQVKGKAGRRSEARARTAKEFRQLAVALVALEETSTKIAHVGAQLAKFGDGRLSEEGVIRNLRKVF